MAKVKFNWLRVDRVEDSGKGYDRLYVKEKMIATVEKDFIKVGDEVAIKGGRVYVAEK